MSPDSYSSQVLPCAVGRVLESGFIPRVAKNGTVLPLEYGSFLESVPEDVRGCRSFGVGAGPREVRTLWAMCAPP